METCKNLIENEIDKSDYICETHPHQIYLELLSEHGIIGTSVILYLLYKLVFSKIGFSIRENNLVQLGSAIYIVLIFIPLIPSGAFFGDYLLTLFALNLSIFYGSSKKLNIFETNYKIK